MSNQFNNQISFLTANNDDLIQKTTISSINAYYILNLGGIKVNMQNTNINIVPDENNSLFLINQVGYYVVETYFSFNTGTNVQENNIIVPYLNGEIINEAKIYYDIIGSSKTPLDFQVNYSFMVHCDYVDKNNLGLPSSINTLQFKVANTKNTNDIILNNWAITIMKFN